MTLLKDLIDIPEVVHKGDFVLKLAEGVSRKKETLDEYIVTEQLAKCFGSALDLVKSGIQSGSSKAAYLHGSFGSGKSHFMAVLHLLLSHDPDARSLAGLSKVVAAHSSWLADQKFLLVPFHMIGATSMESAILGGYVKRVRELHPKADLPAVYIADGILKDAVRMREKLGDESLFKLLNESKSSSSGWGDLEAAWEAGRFDEALRSGPGTGEYDLLVSDCILNLFPAHQAIAAGRGDAMVPLDKGLAAISRHAKKLGYDALILFLDELILWLASRMADHAFVAEEAPKVVQLVETEEMERAIPIVSFVARQRDLREFLGDQVPGAEQFGFAETLKWWEGRFDVITLDDRNLPVIAEKRILRPVSEAAKREIDQAFEETKKVRQEVMDILLTSHADPKLFRRIYPFSPAFMETLVAVSSVLQRERTALKILMLLLSRQRETLTLGEVIPVGDLWDVIAEGDEPFSEAMRTRFERAKSLYYRKLQPLLVSKHEVTPEQIRELPEGDAKKRAWQAEDRLMKTLLLSALVPDVESLRELTPGKLAALNHGSIRSPIPGREAQMVLARAKDWAGKVGEIKVTPPDGANPILSVHLAGVDTEAILEKAGIIDNTGNRRRMIRELLFSSFKIDARDDLFGTKTHEILWKGTRRTVDVVFGNVGELIDDQLRSDGEVLKIIVDFPLDDNGGSPESDLERISSFLSRGETSRTVCWLPRFLGHEAQRDLGKLVILDHILTGERFRDYTGDIPLAERQEAKVLLRNQRDALRQKMLTGLTKAYGVGHAGAGQLDPAQGPDTNFHSLDPAFAPRPPVAADLEGALTGLIAQALAHQFPAHPDFGTEEIKIGHLRKVRDEVLRAAATPDGRIEVEKSLRLTMAKIAQGLKLGQMGDGPFLLGHHWVAHFDQCHARDEVDWSVKNLRRWIDDPKPMGLSREMQNLLVLVFAAQTDRSFYRHGGVYGSPGLKDLPDELELRVDPTPEAPVWEKARKVGEVVFGVPGSPLLNAANIAKFVAGVRAAAAGQLEPARELVSELKKHSAWFGESAEAPARMRTAKCSRALIEDIAAAEDKQVVSVLAEAKCETSPEAMATSSRQATEVARALRNTVWSVFESMAALGDRPDEESAGILDELAEALTMDELAVGLVLKLKTLVDRGVRRLRPPAPAPRRPDRYRVAEGSVTCATPEEAEKLLDEIREKMQGYDDPRLNLNWIVDARTKEAE